MEDEVTLGVELGWDEGENEGIDEVDEEGV